MGGKFGNNMDDGSLYLLERSLIDLKEADESKADSRTETAEAVLEEKIDVAATALDEKRPGRTQEILGKTKLKYLGDRIYFWNPQYAPSDEEMAIFGNVFFNYSRIVRSAMVFYKVLGGPGKHYVNVVLYEETSPKNVLGEANEMLCIIRLIEDGTFQVVEDFSGSDSNAKVVEVENSSGAMTGVQTKHNSSPHDNGEKADVAYQCAEDLKRDTEEFVCHDLGDSKTVKKTVEAAAAPGAGSRKKRYTNFLVAGTAASVLIMAGFFLKPYLSIPDSRSGKVVLQVPQSPQIQKPEDRAGPLSEPQEENRSIMSRTEGPYKIRDAKNRTAPAELAMGWQERQDCTTRPKKQTVNVPAKTQGPARLRSAGRSFPPHSRDDL